MIAVAKGLARLAALAVWAALVLTGLAQSGRGQGELLGRTCPAPLTLCQTGDRLVIGFYDRQSRFDLPHPDPPALAAKIAAWGRQARQNAGAIGPRIADLWRSWQPAIMDNLARAGDWIGWLHQRW